MTQPEAHRLDEVPDSGLADSGLRHTFGGGAQREMAPRKGRFDLLSPFADQELAKHFENGAIKYSARNWEQGLPLSSFVDSARRHLNQLILGDESEPHAVAALWNLHCLVHTQAAIALGILPPELDDLPKYLQQPQATEYSSIDEEVPGLGTINRFEIHGPFKSGAESVSTT